MSLPGRVLVRTSRGWENRQGEDIVGTSSDVTISTFRNIGGRTAREGGVIFDSNGFRVLLNPRHVSSSVMTLNTAVDTVIVAEPDYGFSIEEEGSTLAQGTRQGNSSRQEMNHAKRS